MKNAPLFDIENPSNRGAKELLFHTVAVHIIIAAWEPLAPEVVHRSHSAQ